MSGGKLAAIAMTMCLLALGGCEGDSSAVVGVPQRELRFVSWNIYKCNRGRDAVKAEIGRLRPDFLFVQELLVSDQDSLPRELGLEKAFCAHKNFPAEGIAILTNYPLRNVRPLVDGDGRTFALLAEATVDRRRFTVACVHLTAPSGLFEMADSKRRQQFDSLVKAWRDAGSPPMVVGGDFNQIPLGSDYGEMKRTFSDALARLGKDEYTCTQVMKVRLDYLLCTPQWEALSGGTGTAEASDHRPIWIVAQGKKAAATTQASSRGL